MVQRNKNKQNEVIKVKPIFAEEIHENLDLQDDALKAWLEMLWLRPACALH